MDATHQPALTVDRRDFIRASGAAAAIAAVGFPLAAKAAAEDPAQGKGRGAVELTDDYYLPRPFALA